MFGKLPPHDDPFWWTDDPFDSLTGTGGTFEIIASSASSVDARALDTGDAQRLEEIRAANPAQGRLRQAFYDAMYAIPSVEAHVIGNLVLISRFVLTGPRGHSTASLIELWMGWHNLAGIPGLAADAESCITDYTLTRDEPSFRLGVTPRTPWIPGKLNQGTVRVARERIDLSIQGACRIEVGPDDSYDQARKQVLADLDRELKRVLDGVKGNAETLGVFPDKRRHVARDARRLVLWHFHGLRPKEIIDYERGTSVRLGDGSLLNPASSPDDEPWEDEDVDISWEQEVAENKRMKSGIAKQVRSFAQCMGWDLPIRGGGRPRELVLPDELPNNDERD